MNLVIDQHWLELIEFTGMTKVNGANVIDQDMTTLNGVIHTVDSVLGVWGSGWAASSQNPSNSKAQFLQLFFFMIFIFNFVLFHSIGASPHNIHFRIIPSQYRIVAP